MVRRTGSVGRATMRLWSDTEAGQHQAVVPCAREIRRVSLSRPGTTSLPVRSISRRWSASGPLAGSPPPRPFRWRGVALSSEGFDGPTSNLDDASGVLAAVLDVTPLGRAGRRGPRPCSRCRRRLNSRSTDQVPPSSAPPTSVPSTTELPAPETAPPAVVIAIAAFGHDRAATLELVSNEDLDSPWEMLRHPATRRVDAAGRGRAGRLLRPTTGVPRSQPDPGRRSTAPPQAPSLMVERFRTRRS